MWLTLLPHGKKVLGSIPVQGVSASSLQVLLCVSFSPASSHSLKTCKLEVSLLICRFKIAFRFERKCRCFFFFSICQPCDELMTRPGCTPPLPKDSVIGSSHRKWSSVDIYLISYRPREYLCQ